MKTKQWVVGDRVITPRNKHGVVDFVGDFITVMCDGEDHPCYHGADELKAESTKAPKKAAESKAVKQTTVATKKPASKKATSTKGKPPAKKSATTKKKTVKAAPDANAGTPAASPADQQ